MEGWQLAKQVKQYRIKHDLTVRQFADLCKVSPALVSQIENNRANPSLNILNAISQTLGIPLYMLFMEEIDNASCIMRSSDRKTRFYDNNHHILLDVLTPSLTESKTDLFMMYLKPNTVTANGFVEHDIEEIAYVLKGEVNVVFERDTFVLKEGDTVRILPKRKHYFENCTDYTVQVLFVKST